MKAFKIISTLLIISWLGTVSGYAQQSTTASANEGQSLFYKVTGKDLKQPSYLFGTFHLLTSAFADSLTNVMTSFHQCGTVAGELVIDSTVGPKMYPASLLNGITLDKVLSETEYEKTAAWLKELSGYELSMFNTLNPMTVSIILTMSIQQQLFPQNPGDPKPGMDEYFQTLGRKAGKTVVGLEKAEDQAFVLYTQFSNERQAELLAAMVDAKEKTASDMIMMNRYYRNQNMDQLIPLMYAAFTQQEVDNFLKNRNIKWVQQLPSLMKQSPVFVAVGALHLSGEDGLVQLLRKAGYKVEPLSTI